MGLAASQARFLAITARKADCEFRSMQIAQNKLSVTRELQAATEVYQNALNAETLVWDYDGTGSDLQPVSFGVMMRPSVYNNYNPYLLSDRTGRVIVSDGIAAAAKAAGIDPDKGGLRSESTFAKFILALQANGTISGKTSEDVIKMLYPANGASAWDADTRWTKDDRWTYYGINGERINSSTPYNAPVYLDKNGQYLGAVLKNNPDDYEFRNNYDYQKYYSGPINDPPAGAVSIGYAVYTGNLAHAESGAIGSPKSIIAVLNGTYHADDGEINKIKFAEINNYSTFNANNGYGAEPMSKNALSGLTLQQLAEKIAKYEIDENGNRTTENISLNDFMDRLTLSDSSTANFSVIKNGTVYDKNSIDHVLLSDVLTGNVNIVNIQEDGNHTADSSNVKGFAKDFFEAGAEKIKAALDITGSSLKNYQLAMEMTESQFFSKVRTISYTGASVGDNQNQAKKYASLYNETVFLCNDHSKRNSTTAVNMTNVFNYLFTMMTILEEGFNSGYVATNEVANCNFVTQDPSFRFVVEEDGTETNEAILKTDFYQQLFNNLCINGYKTDTRIQNDNDYLKQMLQNGAYFISSLGDDGHFYQSRYCDADYTLIKVIPDEDAIAVAESEYNYMKIKLTAKEDKLDLDMKNIDMEISALTTEYDSVKNLIAKSVEKTFKQFEG